MRNAIEQATSGVWGWRLTWLGVMVAAAGGLFGLATTLDVAWMDQGLQSWHAAWMTWASVLFGVG